MTPNKGPKKDPAVSTNDKMPIWLNNGSQKMPIKNPKKTITNAEVFRLSLLGKKFNIVFWAGI